MATPSPPTDIAAAARTVVRWVLTAGTAALYAVLVVKTSVDVWRGDSTVSPIVAGLMISISLTFGSAFVGWFGLTARTANITVDATSSRWRRWVSVAWGIVTNLAGAAVLAMLVYIAAGAVAGLTYICRSDQTPTVLITVATAWAAQASAIVAATLSSVLDP